MEKILIETPNGNYNGWYSKGQKNNDIAVIYYHGLGGRSKVVQPLLKKMSDFDFYSIDERGHIDSLQKATTSIKRHDKDIKNVINYLKSKYKKIYLCGESMGALFVARYAYKNNDINGVFCWSIPFQPKDIMQEKKKKKVSIFLKVITSFLFNKNFKYSAVIDYPKLTNSRLLMKMHELEVETLNNTNEEVVTWKASLTIKRKFLHKKPNVPLYYWQGDQDIMSSQKLLNKIIKKNHVNAKLVKNAKHILMFEPSAEEMLNEISIIINKTSMND